MNPALIVVGADKGGVGKTTVSRLLLDYLASRKTPARAFDAEHPRGTLARFHGDTTEIVDLTQTADQMKIIDTLENAGPTVKCTRPFRPVTPVMMLRRSSPGDFR